MTITRCMLAALTACALATAAQAAPDKIPNGPNGSNDSTASLRSYEQMMRALQSAVHTSHGAISLHEAPWRSNTGRAVPYAVIGNGPTAVMIMAQQHGNEMETSDSAINLVRDLSSNAQAARRIRAALTVVVVPRANVDGFDGVDADDAPLKDAAGNTPPWRQNYDPRFTVNPLPAFYQRGRGYDINRYHAFRPECPLDNPNYPNITTGVTSCETADLDSRPGSSYDISQGNPVPEAKNIRWLHDRFKPKVVLDMHHQGTPVHDGRMVTGSTLYPTALPTAQRLQAVDANALARFTTAQTLSKRVVVLIAQTLEPYGYANITRYPGGAEPGISRNAYGLLGAGSVLLELRGGIGTKSGGYIQKIGYHAAMAIVTAMAADPTLSAYNPELADVLVVPANGVRPGDEEGEESEAIQDGMVPGLLEPPHGN